jgi:hypothetical protein
VNVQNLFIKVFLHPAEEQGRCQPVSNFTLSVSGACDLLPLKSPLILR